MLSFRNRLLFFIALLLGGCSSSNLEEYRHIEFASCSWQIPASYEAIREETDDDFRFREKLAPWDYGADSALIVFTRLKSTKESFETSRSLHKDFRMVESEDYLLVRYIILTRSSEELIGEGSKITVLVEKQTGHSVMLADIDIKDVVSGCDIPEDGGISGTTTPE